MPAQRTPRHQPGSDSRRSSSSLSPCSPSPTRAHVNDARRISFDHYYAMFDNDDQIADMSRILAGRPELILRTYMIHHCRRTTKRLLGEIQRQRAIALEFFERSEEYGLQNVVHPFLLRSDDENNDNRSPSPALSLLPISRTPTSSVVPPQSPSPIPVPHPSSSQMTPPHNPRPSCPQHPPTSLTIPGLDLQPTPGLSTGPHQLGSIHNPILVDEDDETESVEDDRDPPQLWLPPVFRHATLCTNCELGNHAYIDCDYFQCPTCHTYAPGHTATDCFFYYD